MNRLYIITFDLISPGRNYETLINRIHTFPDWARIGGNAYLIFTEKNHVEIRDILIDGILNNADQLYVGLLGHSAAWWGFQDIIGKWILERQK